MEKTLKMNLFQRKKDVVMGLGNLMTFAFEKESLK
jgi:hypothetical protein